LINGISYGKLALPVREDPKQPDLAADPTRPRMRAGARPRKGRNQDEGCQADGVEVRGNPDPHLENRRRAGPREGPNHQSERRRASVGKRAERPLPEPRERRPEAPSGVFPFPFKDGGLRPSV
jgi:hypothetical protein